MAHLRQPALRHLPDNRHVLGTPAYADGFGPGTLDLLTTADGSVARSFTSARNGRSATYFDEVWEDAAHVLARTKRCHGFYGASSMERLPTEQAITEQTRAFTAVRS